MKTIHVYYPLTKSEGYGIVCMSIQSVLTFRRPEPYLSTYWSDLIYSWFQ